MPRMPSKPQALTVLQERGIPVGTVIDVGVQTATPELMAAYRSVPHILFEPVMEFSERIRHNYRTLTYELHTVALSDEDGETELSVYGKTGGDITHAQIGRATGEGRRVPKMRLDTILNGRDLADPFLLKIDVDGHELAVLNGAQETLKRCSVVIVECAGNQLPARIQAVQAAGFTLFDLVEPCYYDASFWQCDAVLVRSDLHAERFKRIGGRVEPGLYETFRAQA